MNNCIDYGVKIRRKSLTPTNRCRVCYNRENGYNKTSKRKWTDEQGKELVKILKLFRKMNSKTQDLVIRGFEIQFKCMHCEDD